jgi:anion-transporting  ArsA/GET3 family ATPase
VIAHLPALIVVVGSGGVGKTSLAAALGLLSAGEGEDTLVMTFDPSLRLKDSLGVGEAARDEEVEVAVETPGRLAASLLDARRTFDRLVERYAEDPDDQRRILENRYYRQLAGSLAGILEYMAVERLFEVFDAGRYERIILDTPPTRQALDFLEAPERIVTFLDSGALKLALKPWFDSTGHLKATTRLGRFGAKFEEYLDEVVGLDLLRDMAEFFQAFAPLYDGFRQRAVEVQQLLRSSRTLFVLVAAPGEERNSDTLPSWSTGSTPGRTASPASQRSPRPGRRTDAGSWPGWPSAMPVAWKSSNPCCRTSNGWWTSRCSRGSPRIWPRSVSWPANSVIASSRPPTQAVFTRLCRAAAKG